MSEAFVEGLTMGLKFAGFALPVFGVVALIMLLVVLLVKWLAP